MYASFLYTYTSTSVTNTILNRISNGFMKKSEQKARQYTPLLIPQ
ncbi:unnamed protein product [Amoebophrya sp. A120]|nr:unnamed protein product [Amoebophrya sp. A120]|eukprot:GSA120T00008876001.1